MQPTRIIGFFLAAVMVSFSNVSFADDDDTTLDNYLQSKATPVEERPLYLVNEENGFYLGAAAGVSLSDLQDNRLVTYVESITNNIHGYDFVSNGKYHPNFLMGINGGYEFRLSSHFFLDLGLGAYGFDSRIGKTSTDGKISHSIKDGVSGITRDGDSFIYSYNITSFRTMFETKLKYKIKRFLPFVTLGVGPAWNKAESFSAQTSISPPGFRAYAANRKTSFAYQLGCGIDLQLSEENYKDYVGVYYVYTYLGKISFGGLEKTAGSGLGAGTIITHNIMLNYTHRF